MDEAVITAPEVRLDGHIGPRTVVTQRTVCKGCPALKTEYWKDYGENDETDSGTSAHCLQANRSITVYWYESKDTTPAWCPALKTNVEPSSLPIGDEAAQAQGENKPGVLSAAQREQAARDKAHRALDAAVKDWYAYAGEVDVGPARVRAFDIYETIRTVRRS